MSAAAHARCFHIGNPKRAKVVLIDEAWFSPDRAEYAAFVAANFSNDGATDTAALLRASSAASHLRDASQYANDSFALDLDLLSRLLGRCEGRFELIVGGFDFLEERFRQELDHPETAVLVSLGPEESRLAGLNPQGPRLVADILQGRRPRSEMLFITGRPGALARYFDRAWQTEIEAGSHREVFARLWMLRTFPIVVKAPELLDRHLDGFFHYFNQRFEQDVLPVLARALLMAQTVRAGCGPGDDPAHLDRLDALCDWEQIQGPFPLRDLFLCDESPPVSIAAARIESFKALFSCNTAASYEVHLSVLQALLRRVGVQLGISGRRQGDRFALPTKPGVLFCLGLIRFLQAMGEPPEGITITIKPHTVRLAIPLKQCDVFLAAIATRLSGEVTACFREWLGGSIEPMLAQSMELSAPLLPWRMTNTYALPGHRVVWKPIFRYHAEDSNLLIEWSRV